jgi:hypothetical protein
MPEPTEPSLWDIQRVLTDMRETLKSMVLRVEHEALSRRVDENNADIEKRLDAADEERASMRKLIYTALASIVVSAVLVSFRLKAGTP